MYAIVLFAFLLAIIGYGTLVQRFFHGEARDIPYSAALGVAALLVIGGVVNTVGLAYGPAIDGVLVGGVAIALAFFARVMTSTEGRTRTAAACRGILRWPAAWLVALCFAFTTFFFAPTLGYNPHDDMAQYLTRPYVMMSFGSIGANWFDSTGADSLGGQSWLLAFILRYLPLAYANALDAAVMLSLTCALLAALGARLGAPSWLTAAAVLMFLMLNPSQVNVSAIYSLTLMVAGLAMALLRTAETYLSGADKDRRWLLALVPAGVFLAALPAFKATAALWGVLFAIAFVCVAAISFRSWRVTIAAVAVVGVSGAATVALWLLPFLPLYRASFVAAGEWPEKAVPVPQCRYLYDCWTYAWNRSDFFSWFSLTPVQHGQIGLSSTLCCVLILVALLQSRSSKESRTTSHLQHLLAFSAIGIATVTYFLASPALFPWGYLRYSSPILHVAACIAVLFGGAAIWKEKGAGALRSRPHWRWGAALLVVMVAVCAIMVRGFEERLTVAVEQRASWQLAAVPNFQTGVNRLFTPERRAKIRALQARIPPGSTILGAVITPTHLDFERNPIFPHFHSALSTPWAGDISTATPADIRRILLSHAIEYVIWQYAGDWVMPEAVLVDDATNRIWVIGVAARNALPLLRAVKAQKIGPVLYRDEEYIISRVVDPYDVEVSEHAYVLGTSINFAAGSDYAPYLVSGWSFREAAGVWSDGPAAVLRFDLDRRPEQPLKLQAELSALAHIAPLAVPVEANGQAVTTWNATGVDSTYCATIPAEAVLERTVSITLKIDGAKSPAELGIIDDRRRLGIMLRQVRLSAVAGSERPCNLDP